MKKLGTLFGKDILIDTDDKRIFNLAEKYLENLSKRAEILEKIATEKELKGFLGNKYKIGG